MERGFTVLSETPAALDTDTLDSLKKAHLKGQKLVVAEQYTHYTTYSALLKLIGEGYIGDVNCVNLSLAHDYHAASLMRAFLNIPADMGFKVTAKSFSLPVTATLTRYESYDEDHL